MFVGRTLQRLVNTSLVPTVISTYHMEIIHVREHMKVQEGENYPQNMYFSHHHYCATT
jgi:hypothetical protein